MSASNTVNRFTLQIGSQKQYMFIVKVSVFDGGLQLIENNIVSFPITKELEKGLYMIRVEISGAVKDTYVTVDKNIRIEIGTNSNHLDDSVILIEPPEVYSSALFYDGYRNIYKSSHEYYTMPAERFSNEVTTTSPFVRSAQSSLFIFFRYSSREKAREYDALSNPCFFNFTILNAKGETLYTFHNGENLQYDMLEGWAAFNTFLEKGMYFMEFNGTNKRMIPIYVYENFHTQLFMSLALEPQYGSIRVFINPTRSYTPHDEYNKVIDVLMDKLQNNDYLLNDKLVTIIADGKFDSPMLGLLGAYLYLKSDRTHKDELFSLIVSNLKNKILLGNDTAPDLIALEILSNIHTGKELLLNQKKITGTPMFRIGYEAIRKASVADPALIPSNSLNDLITENLYYDSPLTTFKPFPISEDQFTRATDYTAISTDDVILFDQTVPGSNAVKPGTGSFDPLRKSIRPINIKTLLGEEVFNQFVQLPDTDSESVNWLHLAMAEMARKDEGLTVKDLSEKLQISGNTVNRVLKTFSIDVQNKREDRQF